MTLSTPISVSGPLVEDGATGERQRVAADRPVKVGQEIVVQGRRWLVVEVGDPRKGREGRSPRS